MKLKQLYTMIAVVGLGFGSNSWAQEYYDASAQEPFELLASVGDASDHVAVAELGAAEAGTYEDANAEQEELVLACQQAAEEAGIAPEEVQGAVDICVIENGPAVADADSSYESDVAEGDYVEGEELAYAGEQDTLDNVYAMTTTDDPVQ